MTPLKTLTKASTKTKINVAAGLLIVGGVVAAYGFFVTPAIREAAVRNQVAVGLVTPDKREAQIDKGSIYKGEVRIADPRVLSYELIKDGDPKAKAEVERWLNVRLKDKWTEEQKKSIQTSARQGICDYIKSKVQTGIAQLILECGKNGSSANVVLGPEVPKVTVTSTRLDNADVWQKGIMHLVIDFTTEYRSPATTIDIVLDCRLYYVEKDYKSKDLCKNPKGIGKSVLVNIAKSTVIADTDLRNGNKQTLQDVSLGKVTSSKVDLKICPAQKYVDMPCIDFSETAGKMMADPIADFVKKTINAL